MSLSSATGALRVALTALGEPVKAAPNARRVTASPVPPEKQAELEAYKARCAAREIMFRRMEENSQKGAPHESHDISLPNIESLDLATAERVRDFVGVDIATGADKGMTVHGSLGDKRVSSLREYYSLITKYIDDKTETGAKPSSGRTPTDESAPTASARAPASDAPGSAVAFYRDVANTVQSVDTSASSPYAPSDAAGLSLVATYMAWLTDRAATDVIA